MLIEHYNFLNALYMTIITVTTIGYTEVHPLSDDGKIFNIILIILSFSTFTYALAKLTQLFASGELQKYFKTRQLMQAINKLNNHVIICGFGRNGQQAAHTLKAHKQNFVVIENSLHNINTWLAEDANLNYVHADATEDEALIKAGIERAKALIITLPADADNVFIVLSARSLNEHLQIISRASSPGSMIKLKKAGANSIIMPDKIGGKHMATLVSKPDVVEFIDFLSGEEGESINIEAIAYEMMPEDLRNKTLKEIMDWKKTGVNCIGVKNTDGKFLINPPKDTLITQGMKVIVLGTQQQIINMKLNVDQA
ncbi:potassium channel protein [Panacibacter sp. KCS-6]|uniref:Potassium channel protein n=2 Tax=Limnovirga soli TaxID=2656915 RepID=A0A8J8JT23_9BACT|nr:potassium channel protein [Limnovirga soli]